MELPAAPHYVDFGRNPADFAAFRPALPAEYYDRLAAHGIGRAGQRVVDLGCGTGLVSCELARRGCRITGVDISPELIDEARRQPEAGQFGVEFIAAPAESTGLPDASFDALVAATCWHYMAHDAALAEVRRILMPGSRFAVSWFYWLPVPDSAAEQTEALVLRYNPQWRYAGALGVSSDAVRRFTLSLGSLESYSFDTPVEFSHQAWRARMRSCGGAGVALSAEQFANFDAELAELLRAHSEPLSITHRSFIIIGQV